MKRLPSKTVREYLEELTFSKFLELIKTKTIFEKLNDPKKFWLNTVAKYVSIYPSNPLENAHVIFNEVASAVFVSRLGEIIRPPAPFTISQLLDLEVKRVTIARQWRPDLDVAWALCQEITSYGYTDASIKHAVARLQKRGAKQFIRKLHTYSLPGAFGSKKMDDRPIFLSKKEGDALARRTSKLMSRRDIDEESKKFFGL